MNEKNSIVNQRIESVDKASIALNPISLFELRFGETKRTWKPEDIAKRNRALALFVSLPFDDECARAAGKCADTLNAWALA